MYVSIKQSTCSGKKMMSIFFDVNKKKIKTTHVGASGYEDYTGHQDLQRKMNFLGRHETKENWNDYMTVGSLSRWILWNRPTLNESIKECMRKFQVR